MASHGAKPNNVNWIKRFSFTGLRLMPVIIQKKQSYTSTSTYNTIVAEPAPINLAEFVKAEKNVVVIWLCRRNSMKKFILFIFIPHQLPLARPCYDLTPIASINILSNIIE